MSNARLYKLMIGGKPNLVKAISREQAISHVTRNMVEEITVADGMTVAGLMAGGIELQDATVKAPAGTDDDAPPAGKEPPAE